MLLEFRRDAAGAAMEVELDFSVEDAMGSVNMECDPGFSRQGLDRVVWFLRKRDWHTSDLGEGADGQKKPPKRHLGVAP